MRGSEILRAIDSRPLTGQEFIRWWRRENDFADYELIDDFRERVDGTQEFEGFELLDLEGMWKELVRLSPDPLSRQKRTKGGDVIIWKHRDADGRMTEETCPFNAETVMKIFDAETRGDTLV